MVGQKRILNILSSYSLDNLPHSLLLLGDKGSGKHTIASFLSSKFHLDIIDMTENIDENYINNIYISTTINFYIIDLSQVVEKEQNKILKLVEEPPVNCYLILLGLDKSLILDTILNRCFILELDEYTQEELQSFTNQTLDFNLFKTPGQIINFNFNTLEDTKDLVSKILNNIDKSSYPNFLKISDKINYKDEYDKIDLDMWINLLLEGFKNKYQESDNNIYKNYYLLTLNLKKRLINPKINKQYAVENYLTKLWREAKR